jgi:uncharacterized protein (TIGR03435 family)
VRLRLFLAIVPVAAMLGQPSGQAGQYKRVVVTPNKDTAPFAYLGIPPGPIKYKGATLKRLIMDANGVRGFQIMGGPRWVTTDRWDFEARADGPVVMSMEAHRQTLLRLLENSFQLRAHRETKVMPLYELTRVRGGPNLREDAGLDARGPVIKNEPGSVRFRNTTMEEFAARLSLHLDRPVLDKTGTSGIFTFSLDWAPKVGEDGGPAAAGFPPGTPMPIVNREGAPIFKAIQEQLGLRLLGKEGPVEVIVIDKAERPNAH